MINDTNVKDSTFCLFISGTVWFCALPSPTTFNNYVPPSTKRRKPFPRAESRVERASFTHEFSFHRGTRLFIEVAT
jgi:hypothetical protein